MNSGVPFFTGTTQTQSSLQPMDALEIAQVFFDHLPAGLWIYRADGACLSVNPAGRRISDQDEFFNHNFRMADSWRRSGLLAAAEQTLTTGSQQHCQVNLTSISAHPLWLDCTLTPCTAGGQTYLLLSAENMTAQHQNMTPSIQAIFDAATEAIYLLDIQGVIQAINQTHATRLGRSVEELIGCNLYDLLSPAVAAQRRTYNEQVITTARPLIYEDQHDGLWLENNVHPVIDAHGQVYQLAVFSRDISARKHAEASFIKQEENYRNLFNNMLDGCAVHEIVVDDTGKPVDYRYLAANPAFEHMTGLKAENLIGHTVKEALPGIEDSWIQTFGQVALTGEPVHFEDYTRELNRTYEVTAYRPAPNQFAVITVDISVRKQAESLLLERTRDLMRSNAELEQFAYIASHDLQEPLRMVASFTQLLERRYKDRLDQNANEYIHFITEGAIRMQRLIQDLLSFSRVGTHTQPFTQVSLESVLNDVLENLQVTIHENGAEITHNPLPVVTGDPIQLAQVFQNLIANALKFHSSQPPLIYISASRQGKDWVMSVRDNGIGIAPQYFERIFIIFQRLHNREQYTGTGIGLAICKKIVERHSGRIWVDSIAGQGATFSFTIPTLGD